MNFSLTRSQVARISWEESEYAKYVAGQFEKVTEAEQEQYENWCEMMDLDPSDDHWDDFSDHEVSRLEDADEDAMWKRGC